jgi:hypothetical protein
MRVARRSNLVGSPYVFLLENGKQVGVHRCSGNAHQKRKEYRRIKREWEKENE